MLRLHRKLDRWHNWLIVSKVELILITEALELACTGVRIRAVTCYQYAFVQDAGKLRQHCLAVRNGH